MRCVGILWGRGWTGSEGSTCDTGLPASCKLLESLSLFPSGGNSLPLSHKGAKLRAEKESLSQSRQLSKGGTGYVCYKSAMEGTVCFSQPYKLRGPPPVPTIHPLSEVTSGDCAGQVPNLPTVAGLLWERWKLDTSVVSGTGRRGDKEQQGSRSASSATSPLSQEPIGPNLAFALHFHIPSELQLKTIELFQHSLGLRRQVDLEGFSIRLHS